jgi:two-component system, NtrC family, sensor histidine kinase GlrK
VSHYPRSFLRLIVLGNVLVTLPLLGAVGYASLAVNDLTRRSADAVREASRAATLGRTLRDELPRMERILRQYEVLHDESLLEEYAATRADWQRNAEDFAEVPMMAGLAGRVADMRKAESAAYANIDGKGGELAALATITGIERDLPFLLDDGNRLVEAEREAFRQRSEVLRQRFLTALLAALTVTGIFVVAGRRLIARLWNGFESAVRALGEGKLDQRIQLRGPEDMKRVGQRLEWLRQRLQALEAERTRVVRHASHELKTPLATLREGASLLTEGVAGPLTPQQVKIAGIMQTNAVRLQGLIEGLLRMQQASYAREHMETGPVRLDQVIEQALATFQLAARNRRVRISGSLAPLVIEGGGEALATLAQNLISNAIKFSPDGGLVNVTLAREGDRAVLDVRDDGPGVRPEDQERIFQPFYRGAAGKGVAGVGLGLAIAHECALAHHGTLEVVGSEQGAHFRARLPLAGQAT